MRRHERGDGDTGTGRGQLLLITGILIAVVIIATVVLLNGIRLTDSTGTEQTIRETKQISRTVEEFQSSLRHVFAGVEHNGGPYISAPAAGGMGKLRPNVTQLNKTFADMTSYGASGFLYADVDDSQTVDGTALGRADRPYPDKKFLSTADAADWTLARDLEPTRRGDMPYFRMTLHNQSVDSSANFVIRFEERDTSPVSYLELQFTEQNVQLDRTGLSSPRTLCSKDIGDHRTVVTVRQGVIRFSGTHTGGCDLVPLDTDPTADTAIDRIRIEHGDQADGSFVATVGPAGTPGPDAPIRASSAIVNPAVTVEYDSQAVEYTTTVFAMEGNVEE